MGPWYEIDEQNGEIVWQDASTGWQERRRKYTDEELLLAASLAHRQRQEMNQLLSGFVQV